ncbi:DMT family transporter [Hymenobacter taeanensis]|uniref:DMT family transporter n=1 Tax=Hymenobacter taeanensis TaxID=2735321 RepID=A0A6M6BJB3_9BACT|nr:MULTISPECIES: DMT family transporter [Hymenobacter]QJX47904.1 DMT family transporter [Hymenobacter taeanensis]UOQ82654.1 DMT family transporter [Hymenobacter sp. 5414T-23]
MAPTKQAVSLVGFLVTLLGAILFSTKAIIVKLAFGHTHADAVTLLALRMMFSLPFYLAAAFLVSTHKSNVRMTGREWLLVTAIGLLGYYFSSLFDFLGLQYISAGLERLILFLYPSFAVFINAVYFRQRISGIQRVALLLTYLGIALAYFGELSIDSQNPNFYLGSGLVFLCAVTYSVYIVGSGRVIPRVGANKFTAYAMLAATAGVFVHFLLTHDIRQVELGRGMWVYGLLLAILATVLPSFLISQGMKKIGSNNVAIISGIGPVSTILQAHYVLGEKIFTEQIVGTLLVVVGVLLIGWKRDKGKEAGEQKPTAVEVG